MKGLIDECVPRKFKADLSTADHQCLTVPEAGLAGKENGELLNAMQGRFDLFVTKDRGIQYQQNLADRSVAIIVIRARSNRYADVAQYRQECLKAMKLIEIGQLIVIGH